MSKRKKLIESAKTLLIIALLISAALLLRASGYIALPQPGAAAEELSGGQPLQLASESAQGSMSIWPVGMVISSAEGSRCAQYYNSEQLTPAFESFAAPLAEALGSAASVREITREQWEQRLLGQGVYFEFNCTQPLSLLSALLGSTAGEAGGYFADSLLLSCANEGVELCFESDSDGRYYSCSTGMSAAAVISRAESYGANSAYFAFMLDSFTGLDPDTVIFDTDAEMYAVLSENAAGAVELETLISQLGMNSYVIRPYTEADGTRVYVESGKTLRVGADGEISFRDASAHSGGAGLNEAVMLASALVQQTLAPCCGDAKLCLAGVEISENGAFTASFGYVIGGVIAELPGLRAAAQVTVSGGEVTKLELLPRRYTLTQETRPLLPMEQAAAIASSRGDGQLRLVYADSGNSATCQWVTD